MNPSAEQQAVIEAPLAGPHLVDAGAGTGKTYTLVERAAHLVETGAVQPNNLLVVTFTHAAANEIAARLEARLGAHGPAGRPTCGTFHQIAAAILREFAYDTGISPDVRAIDDVRARGIFALAFRDLQAGRLGVDTSALPLLDRVHELERDLARIALQLKNTNVSVDRFEREALAAADALERLPFGAIAKRQKNGKPYADWPKPNPPLTASELADEADRERRNVRAVAALFRRFDERLAAESLLTFGDVLTRATAMLHGSERITAELRARWLHAMVDEFQDTNPVQVAFLRALFGDALRPVMVVGDVRQAIYAFNGADPQGIVAFRKMQGCSPFPLTTNRRSYRAILDAAHDALAQAGAVPAELHQRLDAHRGEADHVAVHAACYNGPDGLDQEADAVARRARELVDRGVPQRSIAVLMRSRTRANLFAAALRRHGLAVQLNGGTGLFEAPEIREVMAWLRLVDTPDDAPSIAVALQGAAIALGDGALALLAAQGDLPSAALLRPLDAFTADERERIERFRAIVRIVATLADVPVADAVRTLVLESGAEVARLGCDAGELDQVRANLDKFVALAVSFATDRPLAHITDFLIELDERAELDDDEPPAELDGERVSVMTIHAAKGLEWDHVFVANVSPSSLPLRAGGGRVPLVKLDDRRHALAFFHSVPGGTPLRWHIAGHRIDEADGTVLDKPSDEAEEHRLFYVALTRAREAVYVSGRLVGKGKNPSRCLQSLLDWTAEQQAADPEAEAPLDTAIAALPLFAAAAELDGAEVLRRLEAQFARESTPQPAAERRGRLSYTAIALYDACPRRARYHYVLGLPDLGDQAPVVSAEDDHREPSRRDPARFGRIVHGVLESVALTRISGNEAAIDRDLDAAMEEEGCAGDGGLRADALRAVEYATRALAKLTPVAAEAPFDVVIDGVRLGGYIDLIARNAAGRLTIVDYKTGLTPAHHYAMQFALYRRAVAERFPEPADTLLLRIGPAGAGLESVEPATDAELSRAIAGAQSMESDEPRPGIQCRTCPYESVACAGTRLPTPTVCQPTSAS